MEYDSELQPSLRVNHEGLMGLSLNEVSPLARVQTP